MGCGLPAARGVDWRGRELTTCCRACALGRPEHDRRCGLAVEPRRRWWRRRSVADLSPLSDPVWGQIELRPLERGEKASARRRLAIVGFACCPCLVVSCGCLRGEVLSGLSRAELRRAWRRLLLSWSMALAVVQVLALLAPLALFDGYAALEDNPMWGPSAYALDRMGAKNAARILHRHEWWRLCSPMLLHAGWLHLLGNLALQLRAGLALEALWGHTPWLVLYAASGCYASLVSCFLKPDALGVGSSGALCGIMGAWGPFIAITWNQTLPRDRKSRDAQLFVVLTSVVLVIPISFLPMVDWAAHLGGMAFGAALSLVVFGGRLQSRRWRAATYAAGLSCTAACIALGAWLFLARTEPSESLLHICDPRGC